MDLVPVLLEVGVQVFGCPGMGWHGLDGVPSHHQPLVEVQPDGVFGGPEGFTIAAKFVAEMPVQRMVMLFTADELGSRVEKLHLRWKAARAHSYEHGLGSVNSGTVMSGHECQLYWVSHGSA